jgi:cyanophycinase
MPLALVGGDEFRPACDPIDRVLLAGRTRQPVRILPTAAAAQRPELAARNGVEHFRRLGARDVRAVMVLDRASADDAELAAELQESGLIFLAGGDPAHLLATLAGSASQVALEAALEGGAGVAGSSAGAMVLAARMRSAGGDWQPGLGLAAGLAVLPHHERAGAARVASYRAGLPAGLVLLGIDGATAALEDGDAWLVEGQGGVTVYAADARRYLPGERLSV